MHRSIALVAVAGCSLMLSACATHAPETGLVVSNVTIVSPERTAPLQHAQVRIIDGRIAEISTRPLRGATEIDGTNRYLIPGLIDSHVHLAVPPGFPAAMTAEQAATHADIVAATLAQDPKSYLFFGFTTVLDLIGTAERTALWNSRELRPDAYFCGGAALIGGQVRYVLTPFFSYGWSDDRVVPPVIDPAQNTPEAVVAHMAADGAVCVKTFYTGRGPMPTIAEAQALVAAAHARNMSVLIHANRQQSQAFAVAAGVDVIAHGMWRDLGEDAALNDAARQTLAAIARNNIGYQPTTQVLVGGLDMFRPDYLTQAELKDVYPAAFIDWLASNERTAGRSDATSKPSDEANSWARATIDRASEVTRILADANANLLFASDTPSDFFYTNPPGLNGRLEMNPWIAAGVSNEKLFRALTIDNATLLRLQDEIGTVEPGKIANLLLLRADPLQSVDAYDTIETVFLHGRPIARADLSARKTSTVSANMPSNK